MIYFTDNAPEGLCNSLQLLPNATKVNSRFKYVCQSLTVSQLGLIGTPTPFITGRPVTLFHNGKIHGSGAVGVALSLGKAARVDYLGVKTLSMPMTITRYSLFMIPSCKVSQDCSCEGNLVNTINNANPTKLLLSDIRKAGLDGSGIEQYSLGVVIPDEKIGRTYRITAGDPSRGSLSLDSQRAPDPGTLVQVSEFRLPRIMRVSLKTDTYSSFTAPNQHQLSSLRACSRHQPQLWAFCQYPSLHKENFEVKMMILS